MAGGAVSRVLSPTEWAPIIYLGPASPRASSGRFGNASRAGFVSQSDLAPGGVCPAAGVSTGTGALLPHRFTLTGRCARGRSARRSALCCTCRRLTRPAVSWHPALRSPDFPQRPGGHRDRTPRPASLHGSTPEESEGIAGQNEAPTGVPVGARCERPPRLWGCAQRYCSRKSVTTRSPLMISALTASRASTRAVGISASLYSSTA